jgi:hypothetical protein
MKHTPSTHFNLAFIAVVVLVQCLAAIRQQQGLPPPKPQAYLPRAAR